MSENIRRAFAGKDRTGQERLGTKSLLILVHLGARATQVTWQSLASLRASYALNMDDLLPLQQKGWVEISANQKLSMTDAGNEVLRNLLEWMNLQPRKEVGK